MHPLKQSLYYQPSLQSPAAKHTSVHQPEASRLETIPDQVLIRFGSQQVNAQNDTTVEPEKTHKKHGPGNYWAMALGGLATLGAIGLGIASSMMLLPFTLGLPVIIGTGAVGLLVLLAGLLMTQSHPKPTGDKLYNGNKEEVTPPSVDPNTPTKIDLTTNDDDVEPLDETPFKYTTLSPDELAAKIETWIKPALKNGLTDTDQQKDVCKKMATFLISIDDDNAELDESLKQVVNNIGDQIALKNRIDEILDTEGAINLNDSANNGLKVLAEHYVKLQTRTEEPSEQTPEGDSDEEVETKRNRLFKSFKKLLLGSLYVLLPMGAGVGILHVTGIKTVDKQLEILANIPEKISNNLKGSADVAITDETSNELKEEKDSKKITNPNTESLLERFKGLMDKKITKKKSSELSEDEKIKLAKLTIEKRQKWITDKELDHVNGWFGYPVAQRKNLKKAERFLAQHLYSDSILLNSTTLEKFEAMAKAAQADTIELRLADGFRDGAGQNNAAEIYGRRIGLYPPEAKKLFGKGGFSPNHTGHGVTLADGDTGRLIAENSYADIWLRSNAEKYGFIYTNSPLQGVNIPAFELIYVGKENLEKTEEVLISEKDTNSFAERLIMRLYEAQKDVPPLELKRHSFDQPWYQELVKQFNEVLQQHPLPDKHDEQLAWAEEHFDFVKTSYGHLQYSTEVPNLERIFIPDAYLDPVKRGRIARSNRLDYSKAGWQRIKQMIDAANRNVDEQGNPAPVNILVRSAFRSKATQQQLVNDDLKKGRTLEEIYKDTALSGFSEHLETGIDLLSFEKNSKGKPVRYSFRNFHKGKGYAWLMKNAHKFGVYLSFPEDTIQGIDGDPGRAGVNGESWHFSVVTADLAETYKAKAIIDLINWHNANG